MNLAPEPPAAATFLGNPTVYVLVLLADLPTSWQEGRAGGDIANRGGPRLYTITSGAPLAWGTEHRARCYSWARRAARQLPLLCEEYAPAPILLSDLRRRFAGIPVLLDGSPIEPDPMSTGDVNRDVGEPGEAKEAA